jgi:glycosyltransferase involved in cell wall biosynthesis
MISIVIPCYNHGTYLLEALANLEDLNKDLSYNIEVVIVNDGSTDEFTLKTFEEIKSSEYTIIHQSNKGLATARNVGISHASNKYIIPLDSDNKLRLSLFNEGIRMMEEDDSIGVVYGDAQYFGNRHGLWKVGEFELRRLFHSNFIDACALIRKATWQDMGGYDQNMPAMGWEDWDFWMRIALSDWKFQYLPEITFDYRVRDNSMITNTQKHIPELIEYIFNKPELNLAGILREEILSHEKLKKQLKSRVFLGKTLIKELLR